MDAAKSAIAHDKDMITGAGSSTDGRHQSIKFIECICNCTHGT